MDTNGDSGAPIIEPVGGAYYGLLKGGGSTEQLAIPWSSMASNLQYRYHNLFFHNLIRC